MKATLATIVSAMMLFGAYSLSAQETQTKQKTKVEVKTKTTKAVAQPAHDAANPPPKKAICVLAPTKGQEVQGSFLLTEMGDSVEIVGEVRGLTPGKHGFHIHEFGDLRSDDGSSAGGHYNPHGNPHAGPHDARRHVGDLGNITADESGKAAVNMKMDGLRVHFVLGRALVVHAKEDDLKSQPSGDAGGRIAVGVIGIASEAAAGSSTTAPTGAGTKKTKS